jgi:hypothetical protein
LTELPGRDARKAVVLIPEDVFRKLEELADLPVDARRDTVEMTAYKRSLRLRNADGAARYAEIARVLLVSRLLAPGTPRSIQVAVAVLSNTTLILAASLARITDGARTELKRVAALVTERDEDELPVEPRGSPRRRDPSRARVPVINVTLDSWLRSQIVRLANRVSDEQLKAAKLRSKVAYVIRGLLSEAVSRPGLEELVIDYAAAVAQVRTVLEAAVDEQRSVVQTYLQSIQLP